MHVSGCESQPFILSLEVFFGLVRAGELADLEISYWDCVASDAGWTLSWTTELGGLTWLSSHQQSVWCCQFVKPVWNSQPWCTRSRIKKLHTQMRQTPRYPPLKASKGLMCVSVNRGRLVRLFIAMLSMLGNFGKSEFFVIFLKDQQKITSTKTSVDVLLLKYEVHPTFV